MAHVFIGQSKPFTQCSICTATTALCLYAGCHDNGLFSFSRVRTSRIQDCLVLCHVFFFSSFKIPNCNFLSARVRKLRVYRLRPCTPGGQRRITTSTSTKTKYGSAHLFFNACNEIVLCWSEFLFFHCGKCIVLVLNADNNSIGAAGYVVVR